MKLGRAKPSKLSKSRLGTLRRVTLAVVFVLMLSGVVFHTGSGTPSSFGWRFIASVCPLGAVESFLASGTIFPRALIALLVVIALGVLFGKFFCAWVCPIPPLRNLLKRGGRKAASSGEKKSTPSCNGMSDSSGKKIACADDCHSCAKMRKKFDSRHMVLGGALLSTAIFGFPVFCVVCPIGLVFATIIALWRWFGFNDLTFSLIMFPAILLIEVLVLRRWCLKFCPLGAAASLMALPNRFFRPRVDERKCLRSQGVDCAVCVEACDELLDPHNPEGMHECTKCGECISRCPAQAITMPFNPARPHGKRLWPGAHNR
jgi:ferredoxin-type protein NapH